MPRLNCTPMRHAIIRILSTALVALICLVAVGVGALAATVRLKGGEWRMPAANDVKNLVYIEVAAKPVHTIYLQRDAMTIRFGADDAANGVSSLVAPGVVHTIPKYRASNQNWKRLMTCVEDKFAGLDVRFTDVAPSGNNYVIVKVGGEQSDIGKEGGAIGGLAPFNGDPLRNVIVYAFDQGGRYRTRTNCETIAHEVGHIYGLDHTFKCGDIMSYLQCGKKSFLPETLACGEHETRDCVALRPGQNSAAHLLRLLGPAREVR